MMSEPNREALGRMVKTVVAAARKVGLSDDEVRIIVDAELLGGESSPARAETAPVPRLEEVVVTPRPGGQPRADADVFADLEKAPDWERDVESGGIPLGLENLFQITTPPRRMKAPSKSQWDRYAAGEGPVPDGPPGEAK